jgi:citrate lyase beta subunit
MLESQYTRVRRSFRTERMRSSAVKPKKFPRYVEVDDAALAVLESAAEPDHALDQKENILDRLAFQENDLVALMAYRTSPEGEKAAHRLRIIRINPTLRNIRPQIDDIRTEF